MNNQIAWSSSDDDTNPAPKRKRVKKPPKRWRKFTCFENSLQRKELTPKKTEHLNQLQYNFQCLSTKPLSVRPSACSSSEFDESPIIGSMKLSDSPLLPLDIQTSPIIGKRNTRKFKLPFKKNSLIVSNKFDCDLLENPEKTESIEFTNSPELFSSQSSMNLKITVSKSPQSKTQYRIDQISSQESSSTTANLIINSQSSSLNSNVSSEKLYFPPAKNKRKKCKRGGFASQVNKVLNLEKTNIAIWKHEVYLSKTSNYVISPVDNSLIKDIRVLKIWQEFETTLAECVYHDSENNEVFLMLINTSFVDVEKFDCEAVFKLYPPYTVKNILYNNIPDTKCYVNICRLLKCKD